LNHEKHPHQIGLVTICPVCAGVYITLNCYIMRIKPTYIIIIALVGVVVFLLMIKDCGRGNTTTKTTFKTDTLIIKGDPYPVTKVLTHIPAPEIIYVPVPEKVDTAKILKDYYAKKYYSNVLQDDSSAFIAVNDTIHQNELIGRSYTFQNRRTTSIVINNTTSHVTMRQPLFRLGVGLTGLYTGKSFDVGVGATLVTRPGLYVGYSFYAINRGHAANVGWIISFRKRH